jgi:cell division septation protein DedD
MRERKVAELAGANRLLLVVSIIALALLGPSFILGYFWGYRSARADSPQSASGPALAASSQIALPAETLPQRSTRTARQKPAGWGRTKEPASAARTDQTTAGQIYLQLAATPTNQSAGIVDVLRNKGFPALALEVPEKPGLSRVLIGPLHEGELDKTRADLQSRGFPGDSAIKRTF